MNLWIFTLVNAIWLRDRSVPLPGRVVFVGNATDERADRSTISLDAPIWTAFESVAAQLMTSGIGSELLPRLTLHGNGDDMNVFGVSANYFSVLGVSVHGRHFTDADDTWGAEPVAIISDALWASLYKRNPTAIGTQLQSYPLRLRIVGVAAPNFRGARLGERADIWVPIRLAPRLSSGRTYLTAEPLLPLLVLGRLREGDSVSNVLSRMETLSRGSTAAMMLVPVHRTFGTLESRTIQVSEGASVTVVALLAALVLGGGCTTIAALLLVHFERRDQEFVVRSILGESWGRMVASLVGEILVVAALGSCGAVFMAAVLAEALPALRLPGGVDLSMLDLSVDARVLSAALVFTCVTMALASLVPLLRCRAARRGIRPQTPRSSRRDSQRLRRVLLGAHLGGTTIVLCTAALFMQSVSAHTGTGVGFDSDRTFFVRAQLQSMYANIPPADQWYEWRHAADRRAADVRQALVGIPSVSDVAAGIAPIGDNAIGFIARPRSIQAGDQVHSLGRVGIMSGDANLLNVLGIPIVAGRNFQPSDVAMKPTAAVLTASLARVLFPSYDAVGHTISLGERWGRAVVVGVSQDILFGSAATPATGVAFLARTQLPGSHMEFVVRSAQPDRAAGEARRVLSTVLRDMPAAEIVTGRTLVAQDTASQRLGAWFFSGFGVVSVALSVFGVAALVSFLVESKRRELGVRIAVGASAGDIRRYILMFALLPVTLGGGVGLVASVLVNSAFASAFPGVRTASTAPYIGVFVSLMILTLLVAWRSAERSRHMSAMDALR